MNLILLQRVIFQIYKNKEEAAYASLAKFLFVADVKNIILNQVCKWIYGRNEYICGS